MEGETDAKETDNLVSPDTEGEGGDELAAEMTTLLSECTGASHKDEVDSPSKPPQQPHPHPHPYHLKNKYTFRSDSVYSDVIPISAAPQNSNKVSEPREKSGSLSSLKAKESKWVTLKKKLGRLNSNSNPGPASVSSHDTVDKAAGEGKQQGSTRRRPPPAKSLHEKRSLFQRAKTLSILPVNKSSKDREDSSPPKRAVEPPELFNVGGEMNLIPLELLIDVNSLEIRK